MHHKLFHNFNSVDKNCPHCYRCGLYVKNVEKGFNQIDGSPSLRRRAFLLHALRLRDIKHSILLMKQTLKEKNNFF